jgi:putative tricarboxylic transport membrane protein
VPDSFRAIFAPPGISKEARDYYIELFEKTRAGDDWQTYIVEDGLVDFWITGDEAGKYFADATATFTELSEKMGLMQQ